MDRKALKKHLRDINATLEQTHFLAPQTYTDTDPRMLFALCSMELGVDPEKSLDDVESARVSYDKFAPRLSRRTV